MGIKQKILKGLSVYNKILQEKTLQSLEEIEANTEAGHWAGAGALAELNNKLAGFTPILDATGKITGYKTDVGGADTVFPFSSTAFALFAGSISVTGRSGATKTGPLNIVNCAGFKKQSDTQLICDETGSYDIYYSMVKFNAATTYTGRFVLKVNGNPVVNNSCGGSRPYGVLEEAVLNLIKGDTVEIEISSTSNNSESNTTTNKVQCCICKQQS